jgi:hypothetical protein
MTNEEWQILEVRKLGEAIGYGHLMATAHELWARKLETQGLPRSGAHVAVSYPMVKDEYQKEAITDEVYEVLVGNVLDKLEYAEHDSKGVLEKINEKQDSLRATCKAWDEAIEKDGYVN